MSRPKLDLPLKDHNSPRSQWISNVSLLKNHLKDGELVESEPDEASKLSWNELEAKLSKRMKNPSLVSPNAKQTSPSLSKSNQKESVPVSPNNLHLIHHPHHRSKYVPSSNHSVVSSKRPTLKIPTSGKSKDILKRVHSGTMHSTILPVRHRSSSPAKSPKESVHYGTVLNSELTVRTPAERVQSPSERVVGEHSDVEKTSVAPVKLVLPNVQNTLDETTALTFESKSTSCTVPVSKAVIADVAAKETDSLNFDANSKKRREHLAPKQEQMSLDFMKIKKESLTPKTETNLVVMKPLSKKIEPVKKSDGSNGTSHVIIESNCAASVTTIQALGSFSIPNTRRGRDKKTKGSLSWLRRALKPHDVHKRASSRASVVTSCNIASEKKDETVMQNSIEEISTEKQSHPTTPLQLGLWLTEIRKAIRMAQQEQQQPKIADMNIVDSTPASPQNIDDINEQDDVGDIEEDLYYKKNRDVGVYIDYSTFDDGDSVSSLELLFKWLTCRDLNETNNKRSDSPMTPPGTVMATESNVSDELSIDMDIKPTRRTFFAR